MEINRLARLANENPGKFRVIVETNEAVELVACLYPEGKNYGPFDRKTSARAAAILRAADAIWAMQQMAADPGDTA